MRQRELQLQVCEDEDILVPVCNVCGRWTDEGQLIPHTAAFFLKYFNSLIEILDGLFLVGCSIVNMKSLVDL